MRTSVAPTLGPGAEPCQEMAGAPGQSALALGAVRHLDRLLVHVEAQRLLGLDVATRYPDEECVVPELDGMNIAFREHRRVAGLVQELLLQLELCMPRL